MTRESVAFSQKHTKQKKFKIDESINAHGHEYRQTLKGMFTRKFIYPSMIKINCVRRSSVSLWANRKSAANMCRRLKSDGLLDIGIYRGDKFNRLRFCIGTNISTSADVDMAAAAAFSRITLRLCSIILRRASSRSLRAVSACFEVSAFADLDAAFFVGVKRRLLATALEDSGGTSRVLSFTNKTCNMREESTIHGKTRTDMQCEAKVLTSIQLLARSSSISANIPFTCSTCNMTISQKPAKSSLVVGKDKERLQKIEKGYFQSTNIDKTSIPSAYKYPEAQVEMYLAEPPIPINSNPLQYCKTSPYTRLHEAAQKSVYQLGLWHLRDFSSAGMISSKKGVP
ncbi:hypothetical protein PR048_000771 [Dryococelus australis]|uniref:Uncharacterized protein n=1 Tax=Dryococelus australis TaxID=614101 RepID=A0ABQ9IFL2_9NEOP|nr:hypothetical protein PR048_000771 [Dryococelus australis]